MRARDSQQRYRRLSVRAVPGRAVFGVERRDIVPALRRRLDFCRARSLYLLALPTRLFLGRWCPLHALRSGVLCRRFRLFELHAVCGGHDYALCWCHERDELHWAYVDCDNVNHFVSDADHQ